MDKLLSSEIGGKLGKLLLKLECAERVSGEMLRSKRFLDDLEKFHPKTAAEARQESLYSSALIPIIDHAIIIYCSAFNSTDRRNGGIGRFDARNVFSDDVSSNQWHMALKAHRDKNIAHITDVNHKVWYLTSKHDRRIGMTGVNGILQNYIQPGTEMWVVFRQHLEFTRSLFEQTAKLLRLDIESILAKMPDSWFNHLLDPSDNPLIANSWQQLNEILADISKDLDRGIDRGDNEFRRQNS